MFNVLLLWLVVCSDFLASEHFDARARREILDYHNGVRSKLAKGAFRARGNLQKPAGTNLQKLNWDEKLAKSAEAYARSNPKDHSQHLTFGENLYWHWSTKPGNLNKYGKLAGESWIKEFQDLGWNTNKFTWQLFQSKVGHATQMVWANTTKVGCGYAVFPDVHKPTGRKIQKITVVCHYSPRGNYINAPIYIDGKTCSKCSMFHKKCEAKTGLCV